MQPETAYALLKAIQAGRYTFNPHKAQTTVSVPGKASERDRSRMAPTGPQTNFFSDTILDPTWMDGENVFWHSSKRPYLHTSSRAVAEAAMKTAQRSTPTHYYPPQMHLYQNTISVSAHHSCASSHLSTTSHYSYLSAHNQVSTTSYTSVGISSNDDPVLSDEEQLAQVNGSFDKCIKRQSPSERLIPIQSPRPRRLIDVESLLRFELRAPPEASKRPPGFTQKFARLSSRVDAPPPLDMILIERFQKLQSNARKEQYEIIIDSDLEDESEDECDDSGYESEVDSEDWEEEYDEEIVTSRPHIALESPLSAFIPSAPLLQAIPLPPVTPTLMDIDMKGMTSGAHIDDFYAQPLKSNVTYLDFPLQDDHSMLLNVQV